jgi:AcrR family transcriptional regulator
VTATIDWTPKARAVLDAASALFYAHGIHAVGVDAIAERAGVTKKTLYDRFGSKDRLVAEYLAARDARWRARLDERLAAAGPDPSARVRAVFDAAGAWARDEGTRGCAMVNAHAELPEDHLAHAVMAEQKAWTRSLFVGLAAEAGAADADALGEQLLLLHEGAVAMAGVHALDDPFARAATAAAALLAVA